MVRIRGEERDHGERFPKAHRIRNDSSIERWWLIHLAGA